MIIFNVTDELGFEFQMRVDLDNAAGRVDARFSADEYTDSRDGWQSTPFQTASGEHDPVKIAQLVSDYFDDLSGDEPATITDVIEVGK